MVNHMPSFKDSTMQEITDEWSSSKFDMESDSCNLKDFGDRKIDKFLKFHEMPLVSQSAREIEVDQNQENTSQEFR
jgi:hypothetical protein